MKKYSFELKLKVVKEYLKGEVSCQYLADQNGVSSESLVRKWVNAYKHMGEDGLKPQPRNKKYSFEFKLSVVESYLTGEYSYQTLANKYKMTQMTTIAQWIKSYEKDGIEGLRSKRRKDSEMANKKKPSKTMSLEEQIEILKEENLNLKIENEFLKELRRLRQKEQQSKKESQE